MGIESIDDILDTVASDDQNVIYKGYLQLIDYLKTYIISKEDVQSIGDYITFHLSYTLEEEENANNKSMSTELTDNSLNLELVGKVIEAANYLVEFMDGDESDLDTITKMMSSISSRYLGSKETFINDAVDSLVQSLYKTTFGGVDLVLSALETSIVDCDWRKRWHSLVLVTLAVSSSTVRGEILATRWCEMVSDVVSLVNDPNRIVGEQSLQLIELVYRDVGTPFLEQYVDDIEVDIKQTIFERLLPQPSPPSSQQHIEEEELILDDIIDDEEQQQQLVEDEIIDDEDEEVIQEKKEYKPLNQSTNRNNNNNHSKPTTAAPTSTTTKSTIYKTTKTTGLDPFGLYLLTQELNPTDFEKRMTDIIEKLTNSKVDWDIKVNNLIKFQTLVKEGATSLSNFMPQLQKLAEPLLLQAKDIRTQLIKEACTTISVISEHLKLAFEPMADRFIQVLMTNVIVTIQVIAESSDKCIKNILSHTKSTKVLTRFAEAMSTSKSGVLRTRISEYVLLLLKEVQPESLEPKLSSIEQVIKIGLSDGNPEVRISSRQSFLVYSSHWESRSNEMFKQLDPNTRKTIDKERLKLNPTSSTTSSSTTVNKKPTNTTTTKSTNHHIEHVTTVPLNKKAAVSASQTKPTTTSSSASTTTVKPPTSSNTTIGSNNHGRVLSNPSTANTTTTGPKRLPTHVPSNISFDSNTTSSNISSNNISVSSNTSVSTVFSRVSGLSAAPSYTSNNSNTSPNSMLKKRSLEVGQLTQQHQHHNQQLKQLKLTVETPPPPTYTASSNSILKGQGLGIPKRVLSNITTTPTSAHPLTNMVTPQHPQTATEKKLEFMNRIIHSPSVSFDLKENVQNNSNGNIKTSDVLSPKLLGTVNNNTATTTPTNSKVPVSAIPSRVATANLLKQQIVAGGSSKTLTASVNGKKEVKNYVEDLIRGRAASVKISSPSKQPANNNKNLLLPLPSTTSPTMQLSKKELKLADL